MAFTYNTVCLRYKALPVLITIGFWHTNNEMQIETLTMNYLLKYSFYKLNNLGALNFFSTQ